MRINGTKRTSLDSPLEDREYHQYSRMTVVGMATARATWATLPALNMMECDLSKPDFCLKTKTLFIVIIDHDDHVPCLKALAMHIQSLRSLITKITGLVFSLHIKTDHHLFSLPSPAYGLSKGFPMIRCSKPSNLNIAY